METRKFFERRHLLSALLTIMTLIVCAPLCLYLATGSFGYVGWLEILVHIIGWFGFLQCLFFIWYLCMRYFDLCIKRKPAVVAKKDELLVYSPFARHYLHIDWNDISDFQAERAKGCSFSIHCIKMLMIIVYQLFFLIVIRGLELMLYERNILR